MSDLWTMGAGARDADAAAPDTSPEGRRSRRISRKRSLPGSRAVVGALLVTAAAVGVFASYLDATAEPTTSYVVAQTDHPVGTVLTSELLRDRSQFGAVPVDLPDEIDGAIAASDALDFAGTVTVAPLSAGDLVMTSGVASGDATDGTSRLSFPILSSRAVGGELGRGDVIDVVATYVDSSEVETRYVVREVRITDVDRTDGAIGAAGELILTLALPDGQAVLDVAQALDVAEVFVVRSPLTMDGQATEGDGPAALSEPPQDPVDEAPAPPDQDGDAAEAEDDADDPADADEPEADDADEGG